MMMWYEWVMLSSFLCIRKIGCLFLVPGDGGSQVDAKLNKPSVVHYICEKQSSDYFNIWLNLELLVPIVIDCWVSFFFRTCIFNLKIFFKFIKFFIFFPYFFNNLYFSQFLLQKPRYLRPMSVGLWSFYPQKTTCRSPFKMCFPSGCYKLQNIFPWVKRKVYHPITWVYFFFTVCLYVFDIYYKTIFLNCVINLNQNLVRYLGRSSW